MDSPGAPLLARGGSLKTHYFRGSSRCGAEFLTEVKDWAFAGRAWRLDEKVDAE
jgi:hypothetical protein